MLKYIGIIVIMVVCHLGVLGQTYNFTNYNVADGLEQSDILSVSQASNGYLLYGSNGGGLGIYDGYSFKSIKEKHGLSNNVVFSIDIDKKGQVWVATRQGVSVLNSTVSNVVNQFSPETAFYCVKSEMASDDVWLGSAKGLHKYNSEKDTLEFFESKSELLNNSNIQCLYFDKNNKLWVGTKNAGVFLVDDDEVINFPTNELASNYVKTIIEGKDGDVFAGTVNGLVKISKNKVEKIDLPKLAGTYITFTSSTKYRNSIVLGALNNLVYFIDIDTYKITSIGQENGFNHPKIWSVFTDQESNLWFGSRGTGLVKYNPIFSYFNSSNGLISNYIYSIYEDNDGLKYVGFNSGGLNIIEPDNTVKTVEGKELGFSYIYNINQYNGDILLGSNKGLFRLLNERPMQIYFSDKKKVNEDIYFTYKYKSNLYASGKTGFYQLIEDSLKSLKNSPKEAIYNIISFKGVLYLAADKGIYKFQDGNFTFFGKKEGLVCDKARSFRVDSKNNLWIATTDGVYLYNGREFKNINEESGLTSENIYLIELDENGNVWLGSNKGMDRVGIESAYQYWNNIENEIEVRNYGKNEGFNGVECNLNAVHRSANGQLLFGTINGLYTYHTENDELNGVAPSVTLKNIKLNFENVDWTSFTDSVNFDTNIPTYLELKYTDNNLMFEYVGVSLTNSEEVQYQYMLEGLDGNWLPLTKDKKAVYTAIPHGDYTFKLKAKNSDGVWVKDEVNFSFIVNPPWYKTTWFYAGSIIIVLLLGYIIIVVRTRNLKKAQVALTVKVEERTKELREEKEKVENVNTELAHQKKEVEVANKNITDSINYAKKIQDAILPKPAKLEELKESVSVLYMPKDVVSGDFYWFERIGNKLIFAAADCTGHGVPGAFMSMIGVNNLNQIIIENKITSPDRILQELNIAIKKVLKQEDVDSESKDGMDISICCFDLDRNVISYSGAYRPLIYIRDAELHELKASRQPIGGSAPTDFDYELNEFEIKKEDVYYMFSDGYPDQFGGPKGKKFMNKRLKQVFMNIYDKTPLTQRETLKEELITWMGENEQIDDILVMCIKI